MLPWFLDPTHKRLHFNKESSLVSRIHGAYCHCWLHRFKFVILLCFSFTFDILLLLLPNIVKLFFCVVFFMQLQSHLIRCWKIINYSPIDGKYVGTHSFSDCTFRRFNYIFCEYFSINSHTFLHFNYTLAYILNYVIKNETVRLELEDTKGFDTTDRIEPLSDEHNNSSELSFFIFHIFIFQFYFHHTWFFYDFSFIASQLMLFVKHILFRMIYVIPVHSGRYLLLSFLFNSFFYLI